MENNELMNSSEEIMETTAEELTKTNHYVGLKGVSTIGLAMIAGALTYKYVVTPAVSKIKTWHENRKVKNQQGDVIDGSFEEVENEEESE